MTKPNTAIINGIIGQDGSYLADRTEAAYQRGDMLEKRAKLIAGWAKFCSTIEPIGMVVPVRRSTEP